MELATGVVCQQGTIVNHSGHLVLSLLGTCIYALNVETIFKPCRDFPDFSPLIALGAFSFLLI